MTWILIVRNDFCWVHHLSKKTNKKQMTIFYKYNDDFCNNTGQDNSYNHNRSKYSTLSYHQKPNLRPPFLYKRYISIDLRRLNSRRFIGNLRSIVSCHGGGLLSPVGLCLGLQLLDDTGECIRNHKDHDEETSQQNQKGWSDVSDVLASHSAVPRQFGGWFLQQNKESRYCV